MILLIDNYDSFTYNLYQYLGELKQDLEVIRNDQLDVEIIRHKNPRAIVLSPGPGRPEDAGICVDIIRHFSGRIPILGVCLGHQAIGFTFGAKVIPAPQLFHGKTSWIRHNGEGIYQGVENKLIVGRYHSLVLEKNSLPDCLEVMATGDDADQVIMGIRHRTHDTEGIQFHPESILTPQGKLLLSNFIKNSLQ